MIRKNMVVGMLVLMNVCALGACNSKTDAEKQDVMVEASMAETAEITAPAGEVSDADAVPRCNVEFPDDLFSRYFAVGEELYHISVPYSEFEDMGWTVADDAVLDTPVEWCDYTQTIQKNGLKATICIEEAPKYEDEPVEVWATGFILGKENMENISDENAVFLPGGVIYGYSGREDIVQAYGEPTYETEDANYRILVYEEHYARKFTFRVQKESDLLEQFEIMDMIDHDGSELRKAYVEPEVLGESILDFHIEIDGEKYALPCPISEFVEDGYEVSWMPEVLPARELMEIGLIKDGELMYIDVCNITNAEQLSSDCYVVGMQMLYSETAQIKPSFSGGIGIGVSEETAMNIISAYEGVESDGSYYIVYHPNTPAYMSGTSPTFDVDRDSYFQFCIEDGKVVSLHVSNNYDMR